jgi:hypothetical protein
LSDSKYILKPSFISSLQGRASPLSGYLAIEWAMAETSSGFAGQTKALLVPKSEVRAEKGAGRTSLRATASMTSRRLEGEQMERVYVDLHLVRCCDESRLGFLVI